MCSWPPQPDSQSERAPLTTAGGPQVGGGSPRAGLRLRRCPGGGTLGVCLVVASTLSLMLASCPPRPPPEEVCRGLGRVAPRVLPTQSGSAKRRRDRGRSGGWDRWWDVMQCEGALQQGLAQQWCGTAVGLVAAYPLAHSGLLPTATPFWRGVSRPGARGPQGPAHAEWPRQETAWSRSQRWVGPLVGCDAERGRLGRGLGRCGRVRC